MPLSMSELRSAKVRRVNTNTLKREFPRLLLGITPELEPNEPELMQRALRVSNATAGIMRPQSLFLNRTRSRVCAEILGFLKPSGGKPGIVWNAWTQRMPIQRAVWGYFTFSEKPNPGMLKHLGLNHLEVARNWRAAMEEGATVKESWIRLYPPKQQEEIRCIMRHGELIRQRARGQ